MTPARSAIDSIGRLDEHADELMDVALACRMEAGEPHSSATVPAVLARLEKALQTLSAGCYELAADAAPGIAERRGRRSSGEPSPAHGGGLSNEQEARLMSTLHDVAASFARCARSCRDGRTTVTPLLGARHAPNRLGGSNGSRR